MLNESPTREEQSPITYEEWITEQSEEHQEIIRDTYPPDSPMFYRSSEKDKIYIASRFLPIRIKSPPPSPLFNGHYSFTNQLAKTNRQERDEAQQDLDASATRKIEA